ncbi:MAG: hypothetical protein ACRDDH_11770 [Cetobacterium sp.]|uniref:hypothetical protein n=1 Tax=Cetobacterium sp. TaxID=2071632 RepID=UPI003EE78511
MEVCNMLVERFVVIGVQGDQYFLCKSGNDLMMLKDKATTFSTKEEAECAMWKLNRKHREFVKAGYAKTGHVGPYKTVKEFFKWYKKSTWTYVVGVMIDTDDIKNKTGEI